MVNFGVYLKKKLLWLLSTGTGLVHSLPEKNSQFFCRTQKLTFLRLFLKEKLRSVNKVIYVFSYFQNFHTLFDYIF